MIHDIGEDRTKAILSNFVCEKKRDIKEFIRRKAIEFSRGGFAKTTLVYWISDDENEKHLVGYFALATKNILIRKPVYYRRKVCVFRM